MVNADNGLNKSESIARSEANIDFDKRADFFLGALAINVEQDYFKKKKKK